jgi:hypothetical protein
MQPDWGYAIQCRLVKRNCLIFIALKGLNLNNHGCNPWDFRQNGNNPEGVEPFQGYATMSYLPLRLYRRLFKLKPFRLN